MWLLLVYANRKLAATRVVLPICLLVLAGLAWMPAKGSAQVPDLRIHPDSLSLMVGEQDSLVVLLNGEPARGTRSAFQWTSSDESVVSVSEDGTVTAQAMGIAEIRLSWGAYSDRIQVRVLSAASPVSFTISPKSATLLPGEELDLELTVQRADGSSVGRPLVNWTSSDPSVVQISPSGLITAIGPGQALVTGQVLHLSDQVNVTVLSDPSEPEPAATRSGGGISSGGAFLVGLVLPGVGQMAAGKAGRGILVAAATGGAIYWALQSKEEILCGVPASGSTCPDAWILERNKTDNSIGFVIAGGLTLLGAIDAAVSAGRSRRRTDGGALTPNLNDRLPGRMELVARPSGMGLDLGLKIPVKNY